jgi:hypothetical protein
MGHRQTVYMVSFVGMGRGSLWPVFWTFIQESI